jgi:hypothetical protein
MISKIPFGFAILGMVGGIFIAILFGANEDIFKNKIKDGLSRNDKIQSIADPAAKQAKIEKEMSKDWRYYQRFHFHSTGIGTMNLALLTFLAFVGAPRKMKLTAAYLTSVGGFLYPFVWLFAAMYGPEMGRHEAKEAFAFFGYMGGVFLVGTLLILALSLRYPLHLKLAGEIQNT